MKKLVYFVFTLVFVSAVLSCGNTNDRKYEGCVSDSTETILNDTAAIDSVELCADSI